MAEREKELAVIHSQEQLADGIFSMWIKTKAAESAVPGQFISMYTNDGSKLLPRPISICDRPGAGNAPGRIQGNRREYRNRRVFQNESGRYTSGHRTSWERLSS